MNQIHKKLIWATAGGVFVIFGAPLLISFCLLGAFLMKPYSGLFLFLSLPALGLTMLALIFWRNPSKFPALFKADPRHPRRDGGGDLDPPSSFRYRS